MSDERRRHCVNPVDGSQPRLLQRIVGHTSFSLFEIAIPETFAPMWSVLSEPRLQSIPPDGQGSVDDELRCGAGEVGRVPLPARQGPGLGLQFPVDARGGPGELDVAVALDRGFPLDSAFGLGDLFVDAAQRAPRPVAAELVVDDTVGNSY
jgi:hypothetical protein